MRFSRRLPSKVRAAYCACCPVDTLIEILQKYNALHWDKTLLPGR